VVSRGVAAHGSQPQLGKNALLPLLKFLKDSGEDVANVIDYLFKDKWGISKMHNEQGYITFSPNLAKPLSNGGTQILCDCRIPAPFTLRTLNEKLSVAPLDITVIDHDHPPVYTDKNGKFVQTLLNAYNAITGENQTPVSMGGSTFARVFKNGCAFGPEFLNENYHLHEADERVKKDLFINSYEIYKKAIFDLAAVKEDF
ncbi:MAG: M20/M25/M40 family metallo-hydrolase, partial [Clostridia bacterium]|nr:M20/M25/M40 family metallo-hydrolase [Clostridia bacterium]